MPVTGPVNSEVSITTLVGAAPPRAFLTCAASLSSRAAPGNWPLRVDRQRRVAAADQHDLAGLAAGHRAGGQPVGRSARGQHGRRGDELGGGRGRGQVVGVLREQRLAGGRVDDRDVDLRSERGRGDQRPDRRLHAGRAGRDGVGRPRPRAPGWGSARAWRPRWARGRIGPRASRRPGPARPPRPRRPGRPARSKPRKPKPRGYGGSSAVPPHQTRPTAHSRPRTARRAEARVHRRNRSPRARWHADWPSPYGAPGAGRRPARRSAARWQPVGSAGAGTRRCGPAGWSGTECGPQASRMGRLVARLWRRLRVPSGVWAVLAENDRARMRDRRTDRPPGPLCESCLPTRPSSFAASDLGETSDIRHIAARGSCWACSRLGSAPGVIGPDKRREQGSE